MSIARRTSTSRPVSAIFVGKLDLSKDPDEEPTRSRTSLLPSPPHTNSNSSGAGSTGRSAIRSPFPQSDTQMDETPAPKRVASRTSLKAIQQRQQEEEVDDEDYAFNNARRTHDDYDDDHTAKLSDDRRSAGGSSKGGGARSTTSGSSTGALSRAKSLADRNRAVLDKLASITSRSSSRSNTRSPALAPPRTPSGRDHSPFTVSSRSSDPKSNLRSSTARTSVDFHPRLERTPASGSETEREPRSSDDYSITPPSHTYSRDEGQAQKPPLSRLDSRSMRLRSNTSPSPPPTLSDRPSTMRQSSSSAMRPSSSSDAFGASTSRGDGSFGTSRYKSKPKRAPLPQAFRDGPLSAEEPVRIYIYYAYIVETIPNGLNCLLFSRTLQRKNQFLPP